MAILKLKKKPPSSAPHGEAPRKRPPVRAGGPRRQLTLAQAQAERAARDEATRSGPRPRRPADARDVPQPDRRDRPQRGAPEPGRPPSDRRERPSGPQESRPAARAGMGPAPRRDGPAAAPRRETSPARQPPAAPAGRRPPPVSAMAPRPSLAGPAAEGDRLSKRMTALGLASRREADEWIEAGWVRVDGRLAVLGQRVGPDVRIEIDPLASHQQLQRMTVLLNKPIGYVSGQAEDGHEPAVVLVRPENRWREDDSGVRFHPGHLRSLAPAGRLDIDSVGLLVLTQDGRIAKQLVGEVSRIEKEYLVRVEHPAGGRLADSELARLQHGLELDGEPLLPAKVSWQNEDQLRFVLREGKKRQIRRMCEAVGLKVVGLKRVRIGSVVLGPLPPGQWRYLRPGERF